MGGVATISDHLGKFPPSQEVAGKYIFSIFKYLCIINLAQNQNGPTV